MSVSEPPSAEGPTEAQEHAITQLVPEAKSTKRVTKQNLESVQRSVFHRHAQPMLEELFSALRIRIRSGDPRAMNLAAEMHRLVGSKGVNVTTNIQQNNQNEAKAAVALSAKGFDDLVRRLDGRDHRESTNADFVQVLESHQE